MILLARSIFGLLGPLSLLRLVACAAPQVRRTDLQSHDLGGFGRQVVQVRVDFDSSASAAKHIHYGEEAIYVLEGSIEYQLEGRAPVTVHAGEVFFVPAGVPHSACNNGLTVASELATYVVEKGKPLVQPVE